MTETDMAQEPSGVSNEYLNITVYYNIKLQICYLSLLHIATDIHLVAFKDETMHMYVFFFFYADGDNWTE